MMKSYLTGSAALLVTINLFEGVNAVEHPQLASTADFQETWIDRPEQDDMITQQKELRYTKILDHQKRPVIGVLTEPLRGDLYKAGTEDDINAKIGRGVERKPGYVPRTHVQFLEQAGVRVLPVDYRLKRDELVTLFDQLNGLYLPGDS